MPCAKCSKNYRFLGKEWESPCLSISKDCLEKKNYISSISIELQSDNIWKKNKTVKGSGKHNRLYRKGFFSFKGFFLFREYCLPPSGKISLASARIESCLKKLQ